MLLFRALPRFLPIHRGIFLDFPPSCLPDSEAPDALTTATNDDDDNEHKMSNGPSSKSMSKQSGLTPQNQLFSSMAKDAGALASHIQTYTNSVDLSAQRASTRARDNSFAMSSWGSVSVRVQRVYYKKRLHMHRCNQLANCTIGPQDPTRR
ncbi:hypothetical protein BDV98DRAFT_288400 [Pterulicium gracile]|uniref:Uncharacterized protein n=1 Tax=Pterulicium gracile TaxID=1884261 RepID=A0A5C3QXD4_9AGAR|nr:hypothetical protein BDV98DRAFT_288400 [Pterula gracilis]